MKTKEWLYLETDDSCATCGVRGRDILTIHHIDGDDSNNAYDNQIVLCHNCHQGHHQKRTPSKAAMKERKRRLIVKTLTQYGVNALKIASRQKDGVPGQPFLLHHLVELGYLDSGEGFMWNDDVPVLAAFEATQSGRDLVKKWLK